MSYHGVMPNPTFSYTPVASPLVGAEELEQLSRKFTAPLGNHLVLLYGHHESMLRRYHDLVIRT